MYPLMQATETAKQGIICTKGSICQSRQSRDESCTAKSTSLEFMSRGSVALGTGARAIIKYRSAA